MSGPAGATTMGRIADMSTARIEAYRWPSSRSSPAARTGLGTMCTEHWRAYVKGLREARVAVKAADGPEADAA
ncbi:MAG: hypothetical protein R6W93_13800 [Candidatus Limnocylindrales bacterium]